MSLIFSAFARHCFWGQVMYGFFLFLTGTVYGGQVKEKQLPLIQAILAGNEVRALEIIRNFQPFGAEYIGRLFKEARIVSSTEMESEGQRFKVDAVAMPHFVGMHEIILIPPSTLQIIQPQNRGFSAWLREVSPGHQQYFYPNGFDLNRITNQNQFHFNLGTSEYLYFVIDRINRGNIYQRSKGNWKNALHWAASKGMLNVVKALLEKGLPVDLIDGYGNTALHYAAQGSHVAVAKLLRTQGAEIDINNQYGERTFDKVRYHAAPNYDILQHLTIGPLSPVDPLSQDNELHETIRNQDLMDPNVIQKIKTLAQNPALIIKNSAGLFPSAIARQVKEDSAHRGATTIPDHIINF